jgi:ribonuclease BN (tRNA processing enzyme)
MRLTTAGTGTISLTPGRACAGAHVAAGPVSLLLDCGSGVAHRLASLGIDWWNISHVALSHFHADHIGDLPTLLFAWKYGRLPGRDAPLQLIGPPGTAALVERLASAFGDWVARPGSFSVTVVEIAAGGAPLALGDGVTLSACKVPHTEESVAYSVAHEGRRLVYSGDTGYDEAFAGWAAGCDVLLLECSLPEEMAIVTHLTPRQCGALAAIAAPGTLALTHFYPPVEAAAIEREVAERFAGRVVRCTDGWRIDF